METDIINTETDTESNIINTKANIINIDTVIVNTDTVPTEHYTKKYDSILNKLIDHRLTGKLYKEPVLADDGQVYEKNELFKYMKKYNNSSPINPQMTISKNVVKANIISSLVSLFVEHNPELKNQMYIPEDTIDFLNYDELNVILKNKSRYNDILKYKEIDLESINVNSLLYFIENGHFDIQKYFVDNVINLNCLLQTSNSQDYLINLAMLYNNYKLATYLVKKININCIRPACGSTPLHFLVKNKPSQSELIVYYIDNGADIFAQDSKKHSVLNYVVAYCSIEVILHVFHHCITSNNQDKSTYIEYMYSNKKLSENDIEVLVSQFFY